MQDHFFTLSDSVRLAKRLLFNVSLATAVCALAGCAGVTVTPLNPDNNTKVKGAESGLRYYMPMPYLLVIELPPSTTPTNSVSDTQRAKPQSPPDAGSSDLSSNGVPKTLSPTDFTMPTNGATNLAAGASAGGPGPNATQKKSPENAASPETGNTNKTDSANSSQTSPTPVSDVSFGAATPQYVVKMIYLPDMRRPMAMNSSTGLWGTSDMKPVLQDGWMLTSLDATADSKTVALFTLSPKQAARVKRLADRFIENAQTGTFHHFGCKGSDQLLVQRFPVDVIQWSGFKSGRGFDQFLPASGFLAGKLDLKIVLEQFQQGTADLRP